MRQFSTTQPQSMVIMYPEADLPGLHEEQHCIGVALACKARAEQLSDAMSSTIATQYQTAGVGQHQCASQVCRRCATHRGSRVHWAGSAGCLHRSRHVNGNVLTQVWKRCSTTSQAPDVLENANHQPGMPCEAILSGTHLTLPVGWLRFVQVVERLAGIHHDLAPVPLLPVGICRRAADFCGLDFVECASADD